MKFIKTIAERLEEAMQLREMRPADLIRRCNSITPGSIDKGSLSHYLKGDYEPKREKIAIFSKALNVSETWLMGLDVPVERSERIQDIYNDLSDDGKKQLIQFAIYLKEKEEAAGGTTTSSDVL